MAVWAMTKAQIVEQVGFLYRELKGETVLKGTVVDIIGTAMNATLHDIILDPADLLKTLVSEQTLTTTAGTAYVNLAANVVDIVRGSVRIVAENVLLTQMTMDEFYAKDVGENASSTPQYYCIPGSGTLGTDRMMLRPTPDAAYSITFLGEIVDDEDDLTLLDPLLTAALLSGTTANALDALGMPQQAMVHHARFEERLDRYKAKKRSNSGPWRVQRLSATPSVADDPYIYGGKG